MHYRIKKGRHIRPARAPKCAACGLADWCRDYAERNVRLPERKQ